MDVSRTFYFSIAGDDAAAGDAAHHPWRSFQPLQHMSLLPGDRLLLRGGDRFPQRLRLPPGSWPEPVTISSFGDSPATLPGLDLVDTHGVTVSDLHLVGPGMDNADSPGLHVAAADPTANPAPITLERLRIAGFRYGISVRGDRVVGAGVHDLTVRDVEARDNRDAGIHIAAPGARSPTYPHRRIRITRCRAYRNPGDSRNTQSHTGNGIVVSGIAQCLIDHCEAFDNGSCNAGTRGGPVGIWGWECDRLTIEHCVSHHNRCGGTAHDGGGFDLDGGCTRSVLRHNLSYENDGAGYLVCQFDGASVPLEDSIVHDNVSVHDGRCNSMGGIQIYGETSGGVRGCLIENNRVTVEASTRSKPPCVRLKGQAIHDVIIRGNTFIARGGAAIMVDESRPGAATLENNTQWTGP